jgi:hypothetical protein
MNSKILKDILEIIFYCVIIIGGFYVLFSISGCSLMQPKPEPPIDIDNGKMILYKTIYKTNWLITVLILGVGAGIFAFLNGQKFGIPIIVACFASLFTNLAVIRFGNVIAIIGLISSFGVVLYSIFLKDRALKEVVQGVQRIKERFIEDKDDINDKMISKQSIATQKAIKKIKAKL